MISTVQLVSRIPNSLEQLQPRTNTADDHRQKVPCSLSYDLPHVEYARQGEDNQKDDCGSFRGVVAVGNPYVWSVERRMFHFSEFRSKR